MLNKAVEFFLIDHPVVSVLLFWFVVILFIVICVINDRTRRKRLQVRMGEEKEQKEKEISERINVEVANAKAKWECVKVAKGYSNVFDMLYTEQFSELLKMRRLDKRSLYIKMEVELEDDEQRRENYARGYAREYRGGVMEGEVASLEAYVNLVVVGCGSTQVDYKAPNDIMDTGSVARILIEKGKSLEVEGRGYAWLLYNIALIVLSKSHTGSPLSMMSIMHTYWDSGSSDVLHYMMVAAQQGLKEAQACLGMILINGYRVEDFDLKTSEFVKVKVEDQNMGLYWLKEAVKTYEAEKKSIWQQEQFCQQKPTIIEGDHFMVGSWINRVMDVIKALEAHRETQD